jgi:hypothetical protein
MEHFNEMIENILNNAIHAPNATKDKYIFSSCIFIEVLTIGSGITADLSHTNVKVFFDDKHALTIMPIKEQVQFDVFLKDPRILNVLYCVLQYIKECGDCDE